jgi:DNA-directed RNA polymerase specialized sigma24 family protein
MSSQDSVTYWIGRLKCGDRDLAVRKLWETFRQELLRFARSRIRHMPGHAADEEDVVLNAFDSFLRDVKSDRFARLNDRNDLWQILVVITKQKAFDLVKHERRQRRGGGKVLDTQALRADNSGVEERWVDGVLGREPSPASVVELAEQIERLLAVLPDQELRQVAESKLDGHSNADIAASIQRSIRTVERKVDMIRSLWAKELRL